MKRYEIEPFEFEGKSYEIRIATDGLTTRLRVFYKGMPANGFTYQIDLDIEVDFVAILGVSPIKEMIENAKEDILNKRWEILVRELKEIRAKKIRS